MDEPEDHADDVTADDSAEDRDDARGDDRDDRGRDRARDDDDDDDDYEVGGEDDPAFGDDWSAPTKPDHRKMVRTIESQKAEVKRLRARLRKANTELDERDGARDDDRGRDRARRRPADDRDDRSRRGRDDRDDRGHDDRDDRSSRRTSEVETARGYYEAALTRNGFIGTDRELAQIVSELRPRDFTRLRSGRYDFADVLEDLRAEEPHLFEKTKRSSRRDDDGDQADTRRSLRQRRRRDADGDDRPKRTSTDQLVDQLFGRR